MRALILAAGRGTRISRYLSGKPKCTVDIGNGLCLIRYTVDLLKSRGISDIGIVLGYRDQVIRDVLKDCQVKFYVNPFYDVTNSIASAWFARSFVEEAAKAGEDLMIMNGDVYMEEALLDQILAEEKSPVMFADETRKETADYKFFYENGVLKKYGKELSGDDITGEYIGIGRFDASFLPCFSERMNQMIGEQKHSVWWENVLYEMTQERDVYKRQVMGNPAALFEMNLLIKSHLIGWQREGKQKTSCQGNHQKSSLCVVSNPSSADNQKDSCSCQTPEKAQTERIDCRFCHCLETCKTQRHRGKINIGQTWLIKIAPADRKLNAVSLSSYRNPGRLYGLGIPVVKNLRVPLPNLSVVIFHIGPGRHVQKAVVIVGTGQLSHVGSHWNPYDSSLLCQSEPFSLFQLKTFILHLR